MQIEPKDTNYPNHPDLVIYNNVKSILKSDYISQSNHQFEDEKLYSN